MLIVFFELEPNQGRLQDSVQEGARFFGTQKFRNSEQNISTKKEQNKKSHKARFFARYRNGRTNLRTKRFIETASL